ncbi:MAG TPA: translation elongation factor Ts, partial [Coriobacteriia bacterium]|nr:translation elongation factor Ts [Coriobacteriia bacterium]
MEITAAMVKELRESTGAGMMDCKKALAEAEGDMAAAVDVLRTKGLADLAKKAGRATNEGIIGGYTSEDGAVGVLVEVNCETDFVARNADFKSFVGEVARQVAEQAPTDVATLLAQPYTRRPDITVEQLL